MIDNELIEWLLKGDPSIIYQLHRDLLNTDREKLDLLQNNIAESGWGHKLLSKQSDNWIWGNGLYSPKWISSTYTLLLLKRLNLSQDNAKALKGAQVLLEEGLNNDGGINFSKTINSSETYITGIVLSICSYFNLNDKRIYNLIDYILNEHMEDGGWNCQKENGAVHSSMHTTINVLEGLLDYRNKYNYKLEKVSKAENKAHQFLLTHKLFKSDKNDKIIDKKFTYLSFPPRWRYDVLRVMEYFYFYNKEYDNRMEEALKLIVNKKNKNGKWPLQCKHAGRVYFELEDDNKNTRINTLRVLRVLKKYANNCEGEYE
jgi:hypothetical protein